MTYLPLSAHHQCDSCEELSVDQLGSVTLLPIIWSAPPSPGTDIHLKPEQNSRTSHGGHQSGWIRPNRDTASAVA
jgi:hypothetical protein